MQGDGEINAFFQGSREHRLPLGVGSKVSKIRKYHNHTPQTNPQHREEESQDIYINKTVRQLKHTNQIFLFKMIAKLEKTQSNVQQNKDKHRTSTTNRKHTKQQINNNKTSATERTAAQAIGRGGGGLKCILLVPNPSPRFCCC